MKHRILVTEDDPLLMALYKKSLLDLDEVEITWAPTLESARRLLRTERFELALLDLNLTEAQAHEGLELLAALKLQPRSAVVMMSSEYDAATVAECQRRGALAFVPKHLGFIRRLPDVVKQALTA